MRLKVAKKCKTNENTKKLERSGKSYGFRQSKLPPALVPPAYNSVVTSQVFENMLREEKAVSHLGETRERRQEENQEGTEGDSEGGKEGRKTCMYVSIHFFKKYQ